MSQNEAPICTEFLKNSASITTLSKEIKNVATKSSKLEDEIRKLKNVTAGNKTCIETVVEISNASSAKINKMYKQYENIKPIDQHVSNMNTEMTGFKEQINSFETSQNDKISELENKIQSMETSQNNKIINNDNRMDLLKSSHEIQITDLKKNIAEIMLTLEKLQKNNDPTTNQSGGDQNITTNGASADGTFSDLAKTMQDSIIEFINKCRGQIESELLKNLSEENRKNSEEIIKYLEKRKNILEKVLSDMNEKISLTTDEKERERLSAGIFSYQCQLDLVVQRIDAEGKKKAKSGENKGKELFGIVKEVEESIENTLSIENDLEKQIEALESMRNRLKSTISKMKTENTNITIDHFKCHLKKDIVDKKLAALQVQIEEEPIDTSDNRTEEQLELATKNWNDLIDIGEDYLVKNPAIDRASRNAIDSTVQRLLKEYNQDYTRLQRLYNQIYAN